MDLFIQQTLVFIGASVIFVPLFQRFGFGSVLGYLIAGVLIGPFGLKLVSDTESVKHFSELGVTLLLFIIGLEIQPRKLWSLRRGLFGLGGLQVLITSIIFMIVAKYFGFSITASLVIGFGLSLSSTAFAIQMLTEKNQFNTEHGRSSFSILLMQDLCAIPALAVIPILSGAQSTTINYSYLAFPIIILLIFTSRFLIRPTFRLIASTRSREIFTGAALFIVLGVAALMQKVGLSAALGTFIAGMLLADSEYRHELETNIEPFKSLLMGLFFIAVGMGVNSNLIIAQPINVLALTVGYLIIKFVVLYGVARFFRHKHENAKLIALNIAQGGEFAFVLFAMALQFNFISSNQVDILVVVITLSMILSPLLSYINERMTRFKTNNKKTEYDQIKDESPEVIIAGFGRFGQIFGRILRAQSIPFVAIDHDPDQIELVRKFGNKVYYGDASRLDLLIAAGAARAKFFILAIDDLEVSLQTIKTIQQHFPQIKIFARVRNRGHAFDVMDLGIKHIKRETLDSSVYFVRDLLIEMGFDQNKANLIVEKFKRHDELMLNEQFKIREDDKALISLSAQSVAQLAQVLSDDSTKSFIDITSSKK